MNDALSASGNVEQTYDPIGEDEVTPPRLGDMIKDLQQLQARRDILDEQIKDLREDIKRCWTGQATSRTIGGVSVTLLRQRRLATVAVEQDYPFTSFPDLYKVTVDTPRARAWLKAHQRLAPYLVEDDEPTLRIQYPKPRRRPSGSGGRA